MSIPVCFQSGRRHGQITVGADTALDHEYPVDADGDNVYEVTLQVTDGRDGDGNADTAVDHTIALIITVTDVNEPPEFGSSAIELEIAENTATNTNVGDPIAASDPESDGLTYSLAGVDAASFNVDTSSGQIKTKALLDHESPADADGDNVYEVTAAWVTDGRDGDGNADTAVDDTVSFGHHGYRRERASRGSTRRRLIWRSPKTRRRTRTSAILIAATDPESDALTYSLGGADSRDWFDIDIVQLARSRPKAYSTMNLRQMPAATMFMS